MKKSLYCLIACFAILLTDCKNSKIDMVGHLEIIDTLYFQERIDSCCSNYVSSISYIPLMQSEKHISPEATKVEMRKGKIFIYCKELHKIVSYTLDGTFLYEINYLGRGRQEYSEIANFTVDDNYIYVIDNIRHQVVKYSINDGKYRDRLDINFVAWDMEFLNENEFLFAFLPNNPNGRVEMKQPNGAVWKTDSTFSNIQGKYLPYSENYYEMVGKNVYFTKSDQGVVFHSFQNSGFLIFPPDSKNPLYIHCVLPKPISSNLGIKYEDVVLNNYMYLATTPFISKGYIVFSIGKGNIDEPVLFDKKSNKFGRNKESNSSNAILHPSCVSDNSLISYLSDYELYQELVADDFPKANEHVEDVLSNGGACLIIYSMK